MKSNKKITRLRLMSDQEDEYIILGLVSAEPDYKLSLSINGLSGLSLKNISPVKIDEAKGELTFSRFTYTGESNGITYNLISNRSGKDFLLKKLKNIDYILQVFDPENEFNPDKMSSELRTLESVTAVFNIDLTSFSDKNLQYLIQ